MTVDLNCDLGEGFGAYSIGDDETMLNIVSSANVACGFHAGDPEIMARVFALAKEKGVSVGAHPGFPDLWGFGRRRIPFSAGEIERLIAYQVGAAQALAVYAGHRITYVKVHGALGNLAAADPGIATAVVRAVKSVDPSLALLAIALSWLAEAGTSAGMKVVHEIFADRAFGDDRQLVPRGQPGAMIEDAEEAAAHVLAMVEAGAVISVTGKLHPSPIDSICVHGDGAHAVAVARSVRTRLEDKGIAISPFSAPWA
ncbi:LamB/YcsF family protein [Xanthobacter versatilis]|uniref:LamB/YcsF family protein n=1 Tax=Xanthobacter autotrophicus (strain ATCC BAA-1158 / Py2) TaxID=78245 RepID=UPI00372C4E92